MKLFLTLILLVCSIASSRAAAPECISHKLTEGWHTFSSGDPPLLDLPRGFTRPAHGVVVFLGGLVMYPQWWVVDIDRHTVIKAMVLRPHDIAYISLHGYKVTHLPNGGEFAVNTIVLTNAQVSKFICRVNTFLSYKSPEEIQFEASERKFAERARADAKSEELYKKWVHATDHCPKRRDCAGPPPPPPLPPPPPDIQIIPPLPPPTIDTVETLTVLDARSYRTIGGAGPLRGRVADFAQWLMSFPEDSRQSDAAN